MSFPTPRVIVVTGASVGIGAAIVKHQASKGNIVVGLARRAELIEDFKKENSSWKIHALKVDLTNENDIVKAFDWIKTNLKKIDVLINNAGVLIATNNLECKIADWQTMYSVNVFAPGICMRETKPILAEDGHIINVGSIAGAKILPSAEYTIYGSTKHALKVITDNVRREIAKQMPKVRVSLISPGCVDTDMAAAFIKEMTALKSKDLISPGVVQTDMIADIVSKVPIKVPALQAEDVAHTIDHVINTPYSVNISDVIIQPTTEDL